MNLICIYGPRGFHVDVTCHMTHNKVFVLNLNLFNTETEFMFSHVFIFTTLNVCYQVLSHPELGFRGGKTAATNYSEGAFH